MLLDIDKITLELVRGDTFILSLPLNCGTREEFIPYTLQPDDFLYIGIMQPWQSFEDANIRCMLNNESEKDAQGNLILKLSPEHTVNMYPGKYYMTIKFVKGTDVYTLVDSKLFFITGSNPSSVARWDKWN